MQQRRFLTFGTVVVVLLALAMILPAAVRPISPAQIDATQQQQTIDAIRRPRLTLTAVELAARTATGIVHLTATFLALTESPTPSNTFTPSLTPIVLTPTPINATDQFQTLMADVSGHITATENARSTIGYRQTVDALVAQTLGFTATPIGSPTPTFVPPLDETQSGATLLAQISQGLTQTAAAQDAANREQTVQALIAQTLALTPTPTPITPTATPTPGATEFAQTLQADVDKALTSTITAREAELYQRTVEAIIASTLGFTPTPAIGDTPTLDPTQQQQALENAVLQSLTQTLQAQAGQTSTAVFVGTLNAMLNERLTATARASRAALMAGLTPITASNAVLLATAQTLVGHTDAVLSVAFSPDGATFVSGGQDGIVRIWDVQTGAEVTHFDGLTSRDSVAYSPDGIRLAAASSDGTIRLWNVANRTDIAILRGHTGPVRGVAFSPDGLRLASVSDDRTVRVWDGQDGRALLTLRGHVGPVLSLAFSPDGLRLATGGQDAQIILWEIASGGRLTTIRDVQRVFALAFSPDGTILVSAGNATIIQMWNVEDGTNRSVLRGQNTPTNSLAFCADGTCFASAGQDGGIWVWNTADSSNVAVLRAHNGPVNGIGFSPNGVRLISGGADQTIKVWAIPRP